MSGERPDFRRRTIDNYRRRWQDERQRAELAESRLARAIAHLEGIAHREGECALTECGWCEALGIMRGTGSPQTWTVPESVLWSYDGAEAEDVIRVGAVSVPADPEDGSTMGGSGPC